MNSFSFCFILNFFSLFWYCFNSQDFKVIRRIKRQSSCYTQGLEFNSDGTLLYESCGLYSQSSIRTYDAETLELKNEKFLPNKYFAEGIAICGNFLFQLTYKEKVIIKYSFPELKLIKEIEQPKEIREGWGLSRMEDEDILISTDGSNKIFFLDCKNDLKVLKHLEVKNEYGRKIDFLNELTYAKGFIWANQYLTHIVYKINPKTGIIKKFYDMTEIEEFELNNGKITRRNILNGDVLNGIIYNKNKDTFLLTGKMWSYFYEIKFF